MKNLISCLDLSKKEIKEVIDLALKIKKGDFIPDFSGKVLTLIFASPSLRTRLSFANGFQKFGGAVSVLDAANSWNFEFRENTKMDGTTQEHFQDMIRVVSRYSDVIGIRDASLATKDPVTKSESSWEETKKNDHLVKFAKHAEKPVINMESNVFHPCQALADSMTMLENTEKKEEEIKVALTWAPHPKPLPLATPHSQMLLPSRLGMKVNLVCPPGFELDPEILKEAKKNASGFEIHHEQNILKEMDFVIAKSWASLRYFGNWSEEKKYRNKFSDWTLNEKKIGKAKFMHCLPIRRNVVATDKLLDSKNSLIIDEAENRMWAQIALLEKVLGKMAK